MTVQEHRLIADAFSVSLVPRLLLIGGHPVVDEIYSGVSVRRHCRRSSARGTTRELLLASHDTLLPPVQLELPETGQAA